MNSHTQWWLQAFMQIREWIIDHQYTKKDILDLIEMIIERNKKEYLKLNQLSHEIKQR